MRIATKNIFKKRNALKEVLKSPAFIMLIASLVVLTVNILYIGKIRPFNSDDLYWQQVVRTWQPFSGDILYLGTKDIFVEQVPFFDLMEHLFSPSRKLLIFEAVALAVLAFIFFYTASLYFMRKIKIKPTYFNLLPFVWLASFGYPLVQNYLNSSWRTFEVGLSFLVFMAVAAVIYKDINPFRTAWTKLLLAFSIVFVGILIYSDPYFTFFTIGPLVLLMSTLFLLKKIDRVQLLTLSIGLAISFIIAKLIEASHKLIGIEIAMDTPSQFVDFENIVTNIVTAFHGQLLIYGADFFGKPVASTATVVGLINALILLIIVYRTYTVSVRLKKPTVFRLSLDQWWIAFFAGVVIFVFLVYSVSTLVTIGNYRYYIISVYCSVTLLAIAMGLSKNKPFKLITGSLLILAITANLSYTMLTNSVKEQWDVKDNIGNSLNYEIIRAVESRGLEKGYASYWQGNVNTYLADNRTTFLQSLCMPDGKTAQFMWLIDGKQFSREASRSFYIIDPDYPEPPICTKEQLIAQFGQPREIAYVRNKTILIFDYDISLKMKPHR